jgi:hypothetical protein
MIDLRKALEGVPGLLAMGACGLVGTALGFSFALSTEYWIKASDGMANFWGGVVGAGLGSAGAVWGALYVQRQERRDSLTGPINQTIASIEALAIHLAVLKFLISPRASSNFGNEDELREAIEQQARGAGGILDGLVAQASLPLHLHSELRRFKDHVSLLLNAFGDEALADEETRGKAIGEMIHRLRRIQDRLSAL